MTCRSIGLSAFWTMLTKRKGLSCLVLRKMMKALEEFLPESQAGFRTKRSTSDNIHVDVLAKLIILSSVKTLRWSPPSLTLSLHSILWAIIFWIKHKQKLKYQTNAELFWGLSMNQRQRWSGSQMQMVLMCSQNCFQSIEVSSKVILSLQYYMLHSSSTSDQNSVWCHLKEERKCQMGDLNVDCLEYADDAALRQFSWIGYSRSSRDWSVKRTTCYL